MRGARALSRQWHDPIRREEEGRQVGRDVGEWEHVFVEKTADLRVVETKLIERDSTSWTRQPKMG